ncbi:MAG: PilW family protein [Burkholderiaceae bacterium]|nr:PilW family protein [Burkholderiaceae bacterium]
MNLQRPPRLSLAQRGFTLAELMIAITIGLLIMAGMTTLFVKNSRAQAELEKSNRQIENGRFAAQLLSADLASAGFYGEFDPTVLASPAAPPDPCSLDVADLRAALPLHVQGYDNAGPDLLSCVDDVRAGTDIVVVRHTATCVAGIGDCDAVSAGGPFFQASLCNNPSELGSGDTANFYNLEITDGALSRHQRNCTDPAVIRRYLTHIYFVANNDNPGDAIPTLKRAELGESSGGVLAWRIAPLVEGIDNLQLEYGIDDVGGVADGRADVYKAAPGGCGTPACAVESWRKVVNVKLNLLARNTEPTSGYTDAKAYQLGRNADGSVNRVAPAGDAYKRHVFQATVVLPNPAGRNTP